MGPSHWKWEPLLEEVGLDLRANGMPGCARAKVKDRTVVLLPQTLQTVGGAGSDPAVSSPEENKAGGGKGTKTRRLHSG